MRAPPGGCSTTARPDRLRTSGGPDGQARLLRRVRKPCAVRSSSRGAAVYELTPRPEPCSAHPRPVSRLGARAPRSVAGHDNPLDLGRVIRALEEVEIFEADRAVRDERV